MTALETTDTERNTARGGPGGIWLLVLGALLGGLLCCAAAFSPPYEGDAYDYGEVALHWVRHGTMLERHLRYFNIPGQNPTHPAAQRANYYTVLVALFAAIFKDTPWTVFIPGLLSVLAIPFVVYFAGRSLFGQPIAWWAALLCLFNPRLIYHALRDPTPESLLAALCLLSAWLFLRKRYVFSGAALGISFFVKQSAVALLPAYFIYVFLFDRREFRKPALWLGLAAFIAAASPFLIRNQMLFKNPLYTEETASRQHFNPQNIRDGNLLKAIFERGDQAADAHQDEKRQSFLVKTLSLADVNLRDNIIGSQNIDYFPGFLPLIYAACVPLLLAGLWLGRGSPAIRLFVLCILLYLAFHIFIVVHFETRYIFPTLPFGLLIAAYGAFELKRVFPKFRPGAALLFALITGSLTMLPLMAIQTTSREERIRAREYMAACDWLEKHAPEDSTLMAWPPFSAAFFSDRETVPFVYGDLETQTRVIKKYGVDYVLYIDLTSAGELPFIPFYKTIAKGRFLSLLDVDDVLLNTGGSNTAKRFNPLEIVYDRTMSVPVRLDWPLEVFLARYCHSAILAIFALTIAFAAFYFLFTRRLRLFRILSILFLIVFCIGARALFFSTLDMSKFPEKYPAPVNVEEAREFVGTNNKTIFVVGKKKRDEDYISALKKEFPRVVQSTRFTPDSAVLFTVRERFGAIDSTVGIDKYHERFVSENATNFMILTQILMQMNERDIKDMLDITGGGWLLIN